MEVPFAAPSGAPQPAPWQSAESDPKALGAAIRAWEASLRAARAGERSIVVPLDQGEELFAPAAQHDAPRLVEQLRAIPGPVLLVMAMRSEHFAALQQQPWFNERPPSRKKVLGLEAMPQAEYRDVIEGPARVHSERTRQRIEPEAELVDALVEAHAQGQDALPMLALTLETLYRPLRREPVAHLTTAAFEALLRDGTVVQRVLEQAWADPAAPPSIPADDKARTPHLEKLFALLAGFSAVAAQPVRRVASAEAIRALGTPAQALAERLIERRLLTRYGRVRSPAAGDGAAAPTLDGQYVEIAHEAVLRTWPLMAAWLDRRRVDLTLADEVEGAARRWIAEGRRPAWLTLWGSRLPRAERLIRDPDLAARFDADVRGFVRRCRRRVWSRRAGWIVPVVSIVTAASAGAVVWRERANGFPATRHALLAPLWWHIPATRHEPRFVPLLPGRFVEGCVPGRDDTAGAACEPNDPPEEPARDVAFACELQAHEVTVEQYDRFVFKTRPRPYPPIPEGWTGGYPVVNVSVADAQAFARWLCTSGDGGHDYRLPTAAEWEYGARGGATGNADAGPYPWGHSAIADLAPEQRLAPKPVASLEAWGKLYGMSGNVWEWVTGSEPRYPYELRGGAFNATPDRLRIVASMREAKDTANVREGNADSGFRLCRVPKQKEQPCASE